LNNEGYTFIESIVAIAVVTLISAIILSFVFLSFKTGKKIMQIEDYSFKLLSIDKIIREQADNFIVPYWQPPEETANILVNQLWRSETGKYLRTVNLLYNKKKQLAGIRVTYLIGEKIFKTSALFASVPVIKDLR
jgi:prepilin-type N-terminal cleavage/methylation domain-containing protein